MLDISAQSAPILIPLAHNLAVCKSKIILSLAAVYAVTAANASIGL
nr:MAG TPA: hypothetical protein [Bacteriophage sp.]